MTEKHKSVVSYDLKYSRWAMNSVLALYLLSALWGALQVLLPDNGTVYLACAVLFALSATLWARYDSLARCKPFLPVLQMLYFFLWPVAALLYAMIRYGWRGLLRAALHGIGMIAVITFTFYTTFYGLHFAGMLDTSFYPQL